MSLNRVAALVMTFFSQTAFRAFERAFTPEAGVEDAHWLLHDDAAATVLDHSSWNAFLKQYLSTDADGVTCIDYGGVIGPDRKKLETYIHSLELVEVSALSRTEQLTYWLNVYNAVFVRTILDYYPVCSVKDIKRDGHFLPSGPWNLPVLTVEGRKLSLNLIEHRIIRPIYGDPRVHYALSRAARGGGNLSPIAFESATLDNQLEAAAYAFVNSPRGVQIETNGSLVLSKLYVWRRRDFGGSEQAVLDHLKVYADDTLCLLLDAGAPIADYRFDWSLNDAA